MTRLGRASPPGLRLRARSLGLLALFVLGALSAGLLRERGAVAYAVAAEAVEQAAGPERTDLPDPRWLPALSLGYREGLADLLFVRALLYFGDGLTRRGPSGRVLDYAEAMLALDPSFRAVYLWVGVAGLYRPERASVPEIERALGIMEEGARRDPEDGELALRLGSVYCFELAPILDGEAQRRALSRGLPHLLRAARAGAGPAWLPRTNAALLRELGRPEEARRHLEETLGAPMR